MKLVNYLLEGAPFSPHPAGPLTEEQCLYAGFCNTYLPCQFTAQAKRLGYDDADFAAAVCSAIYLSDLGDLHEGLSVRNPAVIAGLRLIETRLKWDGAFELEATSGR